MNKLGKFKKTNSAAHKQPHEVFEGELKKASQEGSYDRLEKFTFEEIRWWVHIDSRCCKDGMDPALKSFSFFKCSEKDLLIYLARPTKHSLYYKATMVAGKKVFHLPAHQKQKKHEVLADVHYATSQRFWDKWVDLLNEDLRLTQVDHAIRLALEIAHVGLRS